MNYFDKLVAESFPRTIPVQAPLDVGWAGHLLLNEENWSVLLEGAAFRFERGYDFANANNAALFCSKLEQLVKGEVFAGPVELSSDFQRVGLVIRVESVNASLRKAACVANECDLRYRMFCRPVNASELEKRAV